MSQQLLRLLERIRPVPDDWFEGEGGKPVQRPSFSMPLIPCTSYAELVETWRDERDKPGGKPGALFWTDAIDITFSVMLAIITSTMRQGAQVWARVLGPPGSVKTTLCEALGTCEQYTYSMGMFTGIHSGQEGQELFQEMNGKTVIINEGDVLLNAPNLGQILSQMRDMWSGKVRARYRNGVAYVRSGLRTTWLIAGTSTLRRLNRSAAGDRFLDVVVYDKETATDHKEIALLNRVAEMALARCRKEQGSGLDEQDDPYKILAFQKTGGFVKHCREVLAQRLDTIEVPKVHIHHCIQLAQLTAYMRARPDDKAEGNETEVELATRLTEQFLRLATCLSVVLDRPVDYEVMRRIARVAKDTCRGRTFSVAEALMKGPLDVAGIAARTGFKNDTASHCVTILRTIGCVRAHSVVAVSGARRGGNQVVLTPQIQALIGKLYQLLSPENSSAQSVQTSAAVSR